MTSSKRVSPGQPQVIHALIEDRNVTYHPAHLSRKLCEAGMNYAKPRSMDPHVAIDASWIERSQRGPLLAYVYRPDRDSSRNKGDGRDPFRRLLGPSIAWSSSVSARSPTNSPRWFFFIIVGRPLTLQLFLRPFVAVNPVKSLDSIINVVLIRTQNHASVAVLGELFINVLKIFSNEEPNSSVAPTDECHDRRFVSVQVPEPIFKSHVHARPSLHHLLAGFEVDSPASHIGSPQ